MHGSMISGGTTSISFMEQQMLEETVEKAKTVGFMPIFK